MNNTYTPDAALIKKLMLRHRLLLLLLATALLVLLARAWQMQIIDQKRYLKEGEARQKRTLTINAHRGDIVDRNGEILAMSTPMTAIWVNPKQFTLYRQHNSEQVNKTRIQQRIELAKLLEIDAEVLKARLEKAAPTHDFLYLKRQLPPQQANKIFALGIKGLMAQREYRRYYPSAEVAGHVLGFTDLDDVGIEGLELAYDTWLAGDSGKKQVMRDNNNRAFRDLRLIKPAAQGRQLELSIDKRIQYIAYKALKSAVAEHGALSGSLVLLDNSSFEVLAMVSQPGFNPNNRQVKSFSAYRNRAIADLFEPGSTMKPFAVAAALELGYVAPDTIINTAPGRLKIGKDWVKDVRNYQQLTVAEVIKFSSNVGVSKIAASVPTSEFHRQLRDFGFGNSTASGITGEESGYLPPSNQIGAFKKANMSYGYGLSVNALQLARAYAVIANDGKLKPVSFVKGGFATVPARQVISKQVAQALRKMMLEVTLSGGTATRAQIKGYQVAGKTGTVHKTKATGGYYADKHIALFAGMAPALKPRFTMVVVIDEPQQKYFGGQVAAPVFKEVMSKSLRILNVPPDNVPPGQYVLLKDSQAQIRGRKW